MKIQAPGVEEEKAEGAGAPRRRPIPCGCGRIPRGRVQGRLGAEPKPQRARLERWLLVPYMTPAVLDGLRGETGRMEGAGRAPGRCRGAGGVWWVAGGDGDTAYIALDGSGHAGTPVSRSPGAGL